MRVVVRFLGTSVVRRSVGTCSRNRDRIKIWKIDVCRRILSHYCKDFARFVS